MVVFLICGCLLIAVALIGREWLLNQERRRLFEICDHLSRDLTDQRVHLDQYAQELHVLRQILMDSGAVSEEELMRLHLQLIQQEAPVTLPAPAAEPARPVEQSVLPGAEVAKNRTLH
jgi:hypothetical protein